MYKRVNELLGTEYKSDSEINWDYLSSRIKLSESFIKEFQDKVEWNFISSCQVLSESFIREFRNKVEWYAISQYQTLSEDFIREFKNKVEWYRISYSQLLSWNFMLELERKIHWFGVSSYQPFIDPNYKKINKDYLKYNKLYHLYQKTKEKGWFVGYVSDEKINNIFSFFLNNEDYMLKKIGLIFWKDLVMLNKTKSFKLLRQVKYV